MPARAGSGWRVLDFVLMRDPRMASPRDRTLARRCAAIIREFWAARGYYVDLDVETTGEITSDMRCGYPRDWRG